LAYFSCRQYGSPSDASTKLFVASHVPSSHRKGSTRLSIHATVASESIQTTASYLKPPLSAAAADAAADAKADAAADADVDVDAEAESEADTSQASESAPASASASASAAS
jgi:hypothetical protein